MAVRLTLAGPLNASEAGGDRLTSLAKFLAGFLIKGGRNDCRVMLRKAAVHRRAMLIPTDFARRSGKVAKMRGS